MSDDDDRVLEDGTVDYCEDCGAEMRWDAKLRLWKMSCSCWDYEEDDDDE